MRIELLSFVCINEQWFIRKTCTGYEVKSFGFYTGVTKTYGVFVTGEEAIDCLTSMV